LPPGRSRGLLARAGRTGSSTSSWVGGSQPSPDDKPAESPRVIHFLRSGGPPPSWPAPSIAHDPILGRHGANSSTQHLPILISPCQTDLLQAVGPQLTLIDRETELVKVGCPMISAVLGTCSVSRGYQWAAVVTAGQRWTCDHLVPTDVLHVCSIGRSAGRLASVSTGGYSWYSRVSAGR
jgi:hypothetical protein